MTTNAPGSLYVVDLTGSGTLAQTTLKTQRLKPKLPRRIKRNGLTLITPRNARTNAGQSSRTVVRGTPARASIAGEVRY